MKEYKIVITRMEDVRHEAGAKTVYTNTHKKNEAGEDIWDNRPKPAHTERKSTEIFSQVKDKIDVMAVVAAINGADWT